ncbi:uncharacterized protein LOC114941091 [Nylanderia fulva]|uniref:uncharacterized protein LOC114941091 n=1 Tax=Nylanderia fulva TaxID=613905 RepID=UPI0010FAFB6B|nr:uncharacterized protein LOC114941091 [Nylanderia fulva]
MTFPSSIAIVFIGVAAYAVTAGPVQGTSNTVQRDEYESPALADLLLARYLEERKTNERTKRNDDPYAYGHLPDEENHLSAHLESDEILDGRSKISVNGVHGELHNSPLNAETFIDTSNHHPYGLENVNPGQLYMHHNHDILDAKEHGRLVKTHDIDGLLIKNEHVRNLDQIGGGHLVRNLDQIGGGHLVRNPDHHDGGHRVRNLDQIGGGHLVRNPDQSGEYVLSNLGYIGNVHIPGNLDHLGDGHPDEIDDENQVRRRAYSNVEARRLDQPGVASRRLDANVASRRLDANVASRRLDANVASRRLDANVASRRLDANVASRRLDAAVASRKLDAALASRKLDAAIAARKLDAAIASRQLQQAAIDSRRLEAAARSLSAGSRNLDGHLLRQARRGLDSLSGATFGENKRYAPVRRFSAMSLRPGNFDEIDRSVFDRFSKRNFDEIDTAFDSFFKRNIDEIDRVGWSGFVKRFNNYLADRQQR